MQCINCDSAAKVVETREYQGVIFRTRKCSRCGVRFYTKEDLIVTDREEEMRLRCYANGRWTHADKD